MTTLTGSATYSRELLSRWEQETDEECRLVRDFFRGFEDGVYVEVGANEPQFLSQTWHLEQRGWCGLLIEPIPELAEQLRRERPRSGVAQAACGAPHEQGWVDFYVGQDNGKSALNRDAVSRESAVARVERVALRPLDELVEEAGLPKVDFLSIDVEGSQLQVLQGFSVHRYRPKLILVEDHLTDLRTHRYLTSHHYRLVRRTALNNWYVPADRTIAGLTWWKRARLWRKLYLGTPLRRLKRSLKSLRESR